MFRTTVDGSFSKNDLENSSSHEEFSPLIDDKNEQLPLTENFLCKRRSTSSSKSPGKEDILPDKRLRSPATGNEATKNSAERKLRANVFRFPPVNANRESSVIAGKQGYIAIDIKSPDSLDDYQNKGNKVPDIKVTKPSEEYHGGGHLIGSVSSSNRADGLIGNMNEGPHTTTDVTVTLFDHYLKSLSSQLFDICEGIDKARFYQKIDFLYKNGCLYDVLFSQNKEGDTLLHVAIKKNDVDLTKEVLRILKRPYNSNNSYKCRYFKDKEESEKPLSKVINTQNKEGKDVITLVIEGNNKECISTVFEYLIRENFNRKNEEGYAPLHEAMRFRSTNAASMLLESENVDIELRDGSLHKACNYVYDEEITQLFIKYYSNKINDLHKRLEDNNRELAQTEHNLSKGKSIFAYTGVISFFAQISKVICDIITERIPLLNHVLSVAASSPGLMVYLIHCTNGELLKYKEENSNLKEELDSCIREREQLENKLYSFQKVDAISKQLLGVSSQLQDYKEENEILKEELRSFRESCSTQMNSVFTQLEVPTVSNVFASPSTKI